MHIKQIVIDGFKSYAQRTEIGPFDPKFNAITGLNGSGKSNILDSICFLLGITNLSQVRASNLQELVYKGGQAGVTKATVTIIFDNANKRQTPLGYESYDEITVSRQVVIGGRNKYLINGNNATPSRVQDLFRSVSLNINNPHFLIMQGRITKVLNMKPPEILSMLEEAAGTKLYESKKLSAEKTIEKKDMKLREIDQILEEDITPKLRKLREERSSYLEYQKLTRELEFSTRLLIAYQFVQTEELKEKADAELVESKQAFDEMKTEILKLEHKISCGLEELKEIAKKRSQESDLPLKELENEVVQHGKKLALADAALKHVQDQLKAEKKNNTTLMKSLKEDESLYNKKNEEASRHLESYNNLQNNVKAAEEELAHAQQHYQAVSSGLSSGMDGQAETLAAQKISKENELSTARTMIKQAETRLKSLESDVQELENVIRTSEKDNKQDKQLHERLQKDLTKLEKSMEKVDYREGYLEGLEERRDVLKRQISEVTEKISRLESKFPNLQFDYHNPTPNFDHSRVKGLVVKLIKVNDPSTATALEVTAGGKLYNVVVDDEETGKLLLEKGNLRRRCTILPLTKIKGRCISEDKIRRATQLVGTDKVKPALSLIGYDHELKTAMEYIFGGSFVCDGLHEAKTVTFDSRVQTRCVSLAGDVFDPSGTLSGGSRPRTAAILLQLQELYDNEQHLHQLEDELETVCAEIKVAQGKYEKYSSLKDQYDRMKQDSHLAWTRIEQSSHHQQTVQLQKMKDDIIQWKEQIVEAKKVEQTATEHLREIQKKLSDSKGHQERELKAANDRLIKARKKVEVAQNDVSSYGQDMETLKLEIAELETSIDNQKHQLESVSCNIQELESNVATHEESKENAKKTFEEIEKKLSDYKEQLKAKNEEVRKQEQFIKTLETEKSNLLLEKKQLEHTIAKLVKDSKEASSKIEIIVSKHNWITTEKQDFGQPNTAYDFTAHPPREVQRKMAKLQEQKDQLGKTVNMRAMNMLGKTEEKYQDLNIKKKIVEGDKAKIAELIEELDQKKNETLKNAWQKVNKDFGSIFSTLLPGAFSKLAPPDDMSELEGLQIKVSFGGVWKESLSELSGGQRSLVALSLILSLLLFNPAPLYILDEVDAALDLSHTQNIGQMLQTHFTHSQFIVVSLKNGMFNNADVLFRTKFVDGVSTVTRYVNPSGDARHKSSKKKGQKNKGLLPVEEQNHES